VGVVAVVPVVAVGVTGEAVVAGGATGALAETVELDDGPLELALPHAAVPAMSSALASSANSGFIFTATPFLY
jgi:hypothetical protein